MARSTTIPAPRYGRRRALSLSLVYLMVTLHVLHWKLVGRTLAPLELNEVMYTLELGVVTAGFLFMLLAMAATCVFGRFFCSWGCHILALEDLSAWLLQKVGARPKPIRARVLRFVPFGAMLYMFAWPQVARLVSGGPRPTWRLWNDNDGWASFLTAQFTRNLPGPGIALLTFGICGFAIIYLLGSRSFCTYVCPYGAVFSLADRLAPGRIVAAGDCSQCGACTAACQSHVRVHEEAVRFGNIINPACLKDLDCVAACPQGALRYGFMRPSLFQRIRRVARPRLPYDFTIAEDALMGAVFFACLLAYRGLYGVIPFLLSLAIGVITAWFGVLIIRLFRQRDLRLNPFQLKRGGCILPAGHWLAFCAAIAAIFTAHSAFIRYHEYCGDHAWQASRRSSSTSNLEVALTHLELCDRFGVWKPPGQNDHMASLYATLGEQRAEQGKLDAAVRLLQQSLQHQPNAAQVHYNLAVVLAHLSHDAEAIAELHRCLLLNPRDPDALNNLGFLCWRRGELNAAATHLHAAIAVQPNLARAHYTLGLVLDSSGDAAGAAREFAMAQRLGLSIPKQP